MTKICSVCGETQPLREEERSWPAVQANRGTEDPHWPHLHLQKKNTRPFRLMVFAGLLALGGSVAWTALTPFWLGTNILTSRTKSESFPSRISTLATTSIHQSEKRAIGAAPERPTVLSDAEDQTLTQRDPVKHSLQESAAAEATESEQSEMTPVLRVVPDYRQIQQTASARTATEQSEEISPGGHFDATTAAVAQQVSRAISARAIPGVKVSYAKSTVYLAGMVKTQTQRLAAEQAARNVPGVKEIRSSIRVQWVNDNG